MNPFLLEALEPRILLSATPLDFIAPDPNQAVDLLLTVEGEGEAATVQIIDQKAQPGSEVLASQALADTSHVQITGSDLDDRLTIDISATSTITWSFSGGLGTDVLVGADLTNDWVLTGVDSGTLNDQTFSSVESLFGGILSDNFSFQSGGSLSGNIEGEEGANTLDYSQFSSGITVDLGAGLASGLGGFNQVTRLLGGLGDDFLLGPTVDTTWNITGANVGNVVGIDFLGFENLTGAADNEDTFVLHEDGRLSGLIEGGTGGFDSLVMNGGTFDSVVYTATGSSSGTINRDGDVLTYDGLEPIFDNSSSTNREIRTSDISDNARLFQNENSLTIESLDTIQTFESLTFNNPSSSLTIFLGGGDDSLTIDGFATGLGTALIVEGESGNDTIVVSENALVSTREIAGSDHLLDPSTGDSGNIEFRGESIEVKPGAQLLAHAIPGGGSSPDPGDIILDANDSPPLGSPIFVDITNTTASISIDGATIKGDEVTIMSTASSDREFDELGPGFDVLIDFFNIVTSFGGDPLLDDDGNSVPVFGEFGGVAIANSDAIIDVRGDTNIEGRTVKVNASAEADAIVKTVGVAVAVAYAEANPTATVTVGNGVVITSAETIEITSLSDSRVDSEAKQSIFGATKPATAFDTTLGIGLSEIESTAWIQSGAQLAAGSELTIRADMRKEMDVTSSAGAYEDGAVGTAFAFSFSSSVANALLDGTVIAGNSIIVEADSDVSKNDIAASAQVGTGLLGGVVIAAKDKVGLANASGSVVQLLLPNPDPRSQATPFALSAAFAYASHTNSASARIGVGAEVTAQTGSIDVVSSILDRPEISARAFIDSQKISVDNPAGNTKENSVSAAVLVGHFNNHAHAHIGEAAEVNAGGTITVRSETLIPLIIDWLQFGELLDISDHANSNFGIQNGLFTSWAQSNAQGTKTAFAFSVNVLNLTNSSHAYIAENALINQDQGLRPGGQAVSVEALTLVEGMHLSGVIGLKLIGTGAGGTGVGGSYLEIDTVNAATAEIRSGSQVYADSLIVRGETKTHNFALAEAGGAADDLAINGAFSLVRTNNRTIAQIDDGAFVTMGNETVSIPRVTRDRFGDAVVGGGEVILPFVFGVDPVAEDKLVTLDTNRDGVLDAADDDIDAVIVGDPDDPGDDIFETNLNQFVVAEDEATIITAGGGITKGQSVGVGFSVSISEIDRDTKALIGNKATDFDPSSAVASEAETIEFGLPHTMTTGQAVVYDPKDGTPLSNLIGGQTYYVIVVDPKTIKLAATRENALGEDPVAIDLDATGAPEEVHRFVDPDKSGGSNQASGKTKVAALNQGDIFSVSVAAAVTTQSSTGTGLTAKNAPKGSGNYGIGFSADVSINTISDVTEAYVSDATLTGSTDLSLSAANTTEIEAWTGAAAISTASGASGTLAGSWSQNTISAKTKSFIQNSAVSVTGSVIVDAETGTLIEATAATLSGAGKLGVAGSVAVNDIDAMTEAFISDSSDVVAGNVVTGGDVKVEATDTSRIRGIAGAIGFGKQLAGIGSAVAVNTITSNTQSYIDGSDVEAQGNVQVMATTNSTIFSLAAAIGASGGNLAASVSVADNTIASSTQTYIDGLKVNGIMAVNGSVTLTAMDSSTIRANAGAVAVTIATGQPPSAAGSVGIGVAVNEIGTGAEGQEVKSYIKNSTVDAQGDITLTATSTVNIGALSIGGAGGGGGMLPLALAGAGSGSGNTLVTTVEASITGSTIDSGGAVSLTAMDESTIIADGGIAAVAIAAGPGGSGSGAVGASVAVNDIQSTIQAILDSTTIVQAGSVALDANSKAKIDALTIAGVIGGATGTGGGTAFGGAGAGSGNTIGKTVEALIRNSSHVTTTMMMTTSGAVTLTATDNSTIIADAGSGGLGASGGAGGGLSFAGGGAAATNDIGSDASPLTVRAAIIDSTITSGGATSLAATSTATINTLAIGIGAALAGGQAGGVSIAGAGSGSGNEIVSLVEASVTGSTVDAGGAVTLTATDDSTIIADAGAGALALAGGMGGGAAGAVGISVAINDISGTVLAVIDSTTVNPAASVVLTATSDATITTLTAVGTAAGAGGVGGGTAFGGAGAGSGNTIDKSVEALIRNTSTVATINGGAVSVTAMDTSTINAIAGSGALAIAFGQGGGFAGAGTGAAATNDIGTMSNPQTVRAAILDSTVTSTGGVTLSATSALTIDTLAIGIAGALAGGAGGGISLEGAGAGSGNAIISLVEALIQNSTVNPGGVVTLTATDSSMVMADAGAGALAVGFGAGGGVGASVGISAASNDIDNTVRAIIDNSTVTNATDVTLMATSTASIKALTIAGAAAGAGGMLGGTTFSGAGAGSGNTIDSLIEALIQNQSDVTATGEVAVSAENSSTITADSGAGGIGFAAGAGGGLALAGAGSVAINTIGSDPDRGNKVKAAITDSTIKSASSVTVSAVSNAVIDALTVGFIGSFAGGSGGGVAFGGAGSVAVNEILSVTEALIQGSTEGTPLMQIGSVSVVATDNSSIKSDSSGSGLNVAIGAGGTGAATIGFALSVNTIENEIRALIDDSLIDATSTVNVSAASNSTIDALAVGVAVSVSGSGGVAGGASGAGADTQNSITNTVEALIENSDAASNQGVTAEGNINLSAADTSTITSAATSVAVSITVGGGAALGGTIVVTPSTNIVSNTVRAGINNSFVESFSGDVSISATSNTTITATPVGVAVGVTAAPASLDLTGGGANATNTVTNTIESYIDDSTVNAGLGVSVTADDTTSVTATVVTVSVGAGFFGVAIGVSLTENSVTNTVSSFVNNSNVTASNGDVSVEADSAQTITADAVAVAASPSIGGAGAGAESTTTINGTVEAYVVNATFSVTDGKVRVQATSILTAHAEANGGAGSAVGIAVMVPNATIAGITRAYASGTVSVTDGDLDVSATGTNTATADTISVGIGALGGAGAGANAEVSRRTESYIGTQTDDVPGATPNEVTVTEGKIFIEATSTSIATVNAEGGAGATGIAIAGFVGEATISGVTRAYVGENTTVETQDLEVSATGTEMATANVLSIGIGTIGGAGAQATATITHSTTAFISDGVTVSTVASSVVVEAQATNEATADSRGGSGGTVTVSAMLADAVISGATRAAIEEGAEVTTGSLDVTAEGTNASDATVFVIGIGSLTGAGANASSLNTATTEAYIGPNTDATPSGDLMTILVSGSTLVTANATNTADAEATGGSGGAASVSAMLANSDLGGATTAYLGKGVGFVGGDLTVSATAILNAEAKTQAIAAGAASGAGNTATTRLTSTVDAYIAANTGIFVADAVIIIASATPSAEAEARGVSGGLGAVAASLANVTLTPSVNASVGGVDSQIRAGRLSISAFQNLPSSIDPSASAFASGSVGGLIGGTGSGTTVINENVVRSFIDDGSDIEVEGDVIVTAVNFTKQVAESSNASGGLVAAGVATASASSDTTTEAFVGSGVSLTGATLSVTARGDDDNFAKTTVGSGGVAAAAGARPLTSTVSDVVAEIRSGPGPLVTKIDLLTDSDRDGIINSADADTGNDGIPDSVAIGQFVGGLDVDNDGIVDFADADTNDNGIPDAAEISFIDQDGDGIGDFADADLDTNNNGIPDALEVAFFGGEDSDGDGIVDFADTDANVHNIGNTVVVLTDEDSNGIFDLFESDSNNDGILDVMAAPGQPVPPQVTVADDSGPNSVPDGIVDIAQDFNPEDGGDVDFDGILDNTFINFFGTVIIGLGSIEIPNFQFGGTAVAFDPDLNNDGIIDRFVSGSGAGSGSDADNDGILDSADALVNLVDDVITGTDTDGDGVIDEFDPDSVENREANLGGFVLAADHTATFNTQVVTNGGGVLSGAGAEADNDVTSMVEAKVGDAAIVEARDMVIDAVNRAEKPQLTNAFGVGVDHIKGATGGVASGAGANSQTRLTLETFVTIGVGAFLDVQGNPTAPGDLDLRTKNEISAEDKVTFTTGGALAGAGSVSSIETLVDLAKVTIGVDAILQSVGEVNISARGEGDVEIQVNAETYGAATVTAADSLVDITPRNEIIIDSGASITAEGDLNLTAGTNTNVERDEYRLVARTDTFAGSAIPIDIVDAEAFLFQQNVITIEADAHLRTARDAKLFAEEIGLADLTARAKAVNWASEIGDAINGLGGGGTDQFEGRSHSETQALVTNQGIVETGIKRHQILTLDSWDRDAGVAFASVQTDGVRFSNSQQLLESTLGQQLEAAQVQFERYREVNDTLAQFYASEIIRLQNEMLALGLAENPEGAPEGEINRIDQFVITVTVEPIVAYPGVIEVRTDQLQGSGKFIAPGDASVTILNETPAFLNLLGITIPDQIGGLILNGIPVLSNAEIQAQNNFQASEDNRINVIDDEGEVVDPIVTPGMAAFSEITDNTASERSFIEIRNTFDPASEPIDVYPPPAIRVLGNVDNLRGDFTVENLKGDVEIRARVRALNINVVAGGNVFVEGVTAFSVEGEAFAIMRDLFNNNGTQPYSNSQANTMANLPIGQASVVGDRIFIDAEYLNINGLLQSGKEDFVLSLGAPTTQEINTFLNSGQSGRLQLKSATNFDFSVFFDTVTRQIEVEEVQVSGGAIELEGHILNTGNGEIRLLGGFGNIEVTNNTQFDMVMNRVDASQRGTGTLVIKDKARAATLGGSPLATIYEKTADGVKITQDDGSGPVVTTGGDQSTYDPKSGWRYGWTIAQERALRKFKLFATSKWLGIDALAPNPATIKWDRIVNITQPQLTPEGPYYFLDESLTNDPYTHTGAQQDLSARLYTNRSWTTSTWYGKKTYYKEVVQEERFVEFDTHTIKADRPIDISFIGLEEGRVSITSTSGGADVLLNGAILNPTGLTQISSQGTIEQLSDAATIGGRQIVLFARDGIGAEGALQTNLSEISFQFMNESGQVFLNTPDFEFTATTTTGEIQLQDFLLGTRVRLADNFDPVRGQSGRVYQFFGQNEIGVDLNAENYLNPLRWVEITQDTQDQVKLTDDFIGSGVAGAVYRFIGEPQLVDLATENYIDQSRWRIVDFFPSLQATSTNGAIQIEEIIGDLSIDRIVAGNGSDVNLVSHGGIIVGQQTTSNFFEGLVQGGTVTLSAEGGGIGEHGRLLVLDSGELLKDKVNVTAAGDVFLQEKFGDLRVEKVTATGDVFIEVLDGDLLDVNQDAEVDERTVEELRAGVWTDLQLTEGTGALGKIDDTVASAEAIKKQEYRTYWQFRNTQQDPSMFDPNHEITLSTAELAFFDGFFRQQAIDQNEPDIDLFVQNAITTLENSRTAQFRALHDQYGRFNTEAVPSRIEVGDVVDINVFDENYQGTLLTQEDQTIRNGIKIWTEEELLFTISAGLLKSVSDTQVTIEDPNIIGNQVTLLVSGGVGQAEGQTIIDLTTTPVQLTDEERVALAAAERIDVIYLGGDPVTTTVDFANNGTDPHTITRTDGGSWLTDGFQAGMFIQVQGNTANESEDQEVFELAAVSDAVLFLVTTDVLGPEIGVDVTIVPVVPDPTAAGVVVTAIQINQREDIDVDATGTISITAGEQVFLGSEFDLRIESVRAGDQLIEGKVRIKGGQSIINEAGSGIAAVKSSDLILEAAEGSIGDETRQFLTDLIGNGTITARADGDVYLTELSGDMNVETIFSRTGAVFLEADGSIVDALNHDFTNIQSQVLFITAGLGVAGGGIGEVGDRLDIDVVGSGLVTATAEGSIGLNETFGSMNVRNILSRTGDVDLKAQLSILDSVDLVDPTNPDSGDVVVGPGGESLPKADVIGNNIKLTAVFGAIGEVLNDLDVDTGFSGPGALSAATDLGNIFIIEVTGDLHLDQVGTGDTTTAFITVPTGSIFNGNPDPDGVNVNSGKTFLIAGQDIGQAGNPLATQVGNIEAISTAGSTYISNAGALTVGGVVNSGDPGITAAGGINLSASSPITLIEDITAKDEIIVVAVDDDNDTDPADEDNLVVETGVSIMSTESFIRLLAGDALIIRAGATVSAADFVELYGDWQGDEEGYPPPVNQENIDPGMGGEISILGVVESVVKIDVRGGEDDDHIMLSGVLVAPQINVISGKGNDQVEFTAGVLTASEKITVVGGDGTDVVTLQNGVLNSPSIDLLGDSLDNLLGSAEDTLVAEDQTNEWHITDVNTGDINGTVNFFGFGSLTGGSLDDTFFFIGQGNATGVVDGGGHILEDVLDWIDSDLIQEAAMSLQAVQPLLPIGEEIVEFAPIGVGIRNIEKILAIILGEVDSDGTLHLNMGPRAALRLGINTEDGDETFVVGPVVEQIATLNSPEGETVSITYSTILDNLEVFRITLDYEGVKHIRGIGGDGDDSVTIDEGVLSPVTLWGDHEDLFLGIPGDDTLLVYGSGEAILFGGFGNDELRGGTGDDELIGGPGDDHLYGSEGHDVLLGDTGQIFPRSNGDPVPQLVSSGPVPKDVLLTELAFIVGQIALNNGTGVPLGDRATVDALLEADVTLLAGAYNANGTQRLNADGSWDSRALLLQLIADGNDILFGGDGHDLLFGQGGVDILGGDGGNDLLSGGAGDDQLSGGHENDQVVGDDVYIDSGDSELPNVTHGFLVVHTDDSTEAAAGITLGENGTTIVPMTSVEPGRGFEDVVTILPHLFGYQSTVPINNRLDTEDLDTNDTGYFLPYSAVITDFRHHLDQLQGNDMLEGNDGNDLLVGDDMTVVARAVEFDSAAMDRADAITRRFLDISDDFSDLIHEQYRLILPQPGDDDDDDDDDDRDHFLVIDSTIMIGEDSLDGGMDDDVLVGDSHTLIGPEFTMTVGLTTDFERFVDGMSDGGKEVVHAVQDLHHLDRKLRDVIIQVPHKKHFHQAIEHHVDLVRLGNDDIKGNDGNDLIIGDNFDVRTPSVILLANDFTPHSWNGQSWKNDDWKNRKRDGGFRAHHEFDDDDDHHDSREDVIQVGADTISGGAGDDWIFGDSVALLTGMVTRGEGIDKKDYKRAEDDAEDALDRLTSVIEPVDVWFNVDDRDHDEDNDDRKDDRDDDERRNRKYDRDDDDDDHRNDKYRYHPQHFNNNGDTISGEEGNDVIFGQDGNDTLSGGTGDDFLFGQDGRDVLFGEEGRDVLYGGSDHDKVSGGPDKDKVHNGKAPHKLVDFLLNQRFASTVVSQPWMLDFLSDSNNLEGSESPNEGLVVVPDG